MDLQTLCKHLPQITIKGKKDRFITGMTAHSQSVAPGNLFVARGRGVEYIPQAVASGAGAILTDVFDPFLHTAAQLITDDVQQAAQILSNRFYHNPGSQLYLIGITGTNGKTTTSYLIAHLLKNCGLIGSIERRIKDKRLAAPINTPDLLTCQKLLRDMVEQSLSAAVMEVSSHGLDQRRIDGLDFNVAVFTNLTQDHLDYHHTMEEYCRAKARFFTFVDTPKKWAVVNADDPAHSAMLLATRAHPLTYGIDSGALRARNLNLSAHGIEGTVTYLEQTSPLHLPLIGRFNVYNALAAIGVGLSYGLDLATCCDSLSSFTQVPGRMERVKNEKGLSIFIDYAHTEDSLQNALQILREISPKRILTVFGCGGDRDRGKRPKMGRIAERHSDIVIVTSDNPRSEDPQSIIDQILAGVEQPEKIYHDIDRRRAIQHALALAEKEDTVLIAGKGHETYQIFAKETIFFDDRLAIHAPQNR